MYEKISQKLALQVAQLSYDKATLETQNEELQARVMELEAQAVEHNQPAKIEGE